MGPVPQYHFGVYARILDARIPEAQRILLVRKTRGPYTGLLDLPGGQPEPGETWAQTLERELYEELGVQPTASPQVTASPQLTASTGFAGFIASTGFAEFSVHVERSSAGDLIDFHHRGVFADVLPPADPPNAHRSPDTAGAEWFDLRTGDSKRLSAAVRAVLGVR